jgi:hypothetical protein
VQEWVASYKPIWMVVALLNSCFSFFWDVVFDWDFSLLSGEWVPLPLQFQFEHSSHPCVHLVKHKVNGYILPSDLV